VVVLERQDAGSSSAGSDAWLLSAAAEREAEVRLSSLGITVPLAKIYAGVGFPRSRRPSSATNAAGDLSHAPATSTN